MFKVGSWFLQSYKKVTTFDYYRTSTSLLWQCLPIRVREKFIQFSFYSIFFGIGIVLDHKNALVLFLSQYLS